MRRPLFCGYVFARFDPKRTAWQPIEAINGVVRIVSFADEPHPIPEGIVEKIRAKCAQEEEKTLLRGKPRSRFEGGQRVRARVAGSYLEGLFLVGDAERVTLLLDMLGALRPIVLPDALVALA